MSTPRLLSNRYELGETLGYGGMSEVHRGRDVRLGREVAVKVLRADLARDPQFQERFRREAQNAAALNHPAIVAVYDTGETKTEYGPLPYIVMEYVDGRTLRDIVKTQGPLSGKRAMEIMADVCAALDFSHRHGIVHRDVKPANVMITRTGAVKVMDFGIARAVADGQASVTQTAAVIGTAQYLSPEQARGEAVDARSDVYAAGCVLFELLTGEPPFTGDSPVAVAYQHVREEPKPPSSLNPQVTPALDAIALKALSKNPANRYQSAAEMRADLVRVLSGQRPAAPMVMTEADRTSILGGGPGPTEVMPSGGGRHRQESVADGGYGDGGDGRGGRRRGWMIAGVVVLCLAVLALAAWLTTNLLSGGGSSQGNKTSVPVNLVGMTSSQARSTLTAAGLKMNQVSVPCQPDASGRAPCGQDQVDRVLADGIDPPPGTQVDKGSTVNVRVGVSPQPVAVPDLTGMTVPEAQAALADKHLQLGQNVQQQVTDDATKIGKVIDQTPSPGQQIAAGGTVSITIGKAPDLVFVTDYTGQTQDVATANLQGLGLKVAIKTVSSNQPKGVVVDQNPKNTKAQKGSTVQLLVSNGDQLIVMPDLTQMTVEQAKAKLQSLGWDGTLQITFIPITDLTQNNRIVSQQQAPGTQVGKDSTVNVTVGRFGAATSSTSSGG
ncbi:Stk1 family PASTA domain-containing Ser/Thr kinase [Gandjariella thermophila]|uniref:non-specific serine/threonine protein kinase n=1 Tax=Gandjariella thermophila TaxID=1931992 RepID=A0A4D4J8Y4_9PSEU|nr:Stk1 family PASTA domain-containing Ser/Thr kinase [Gandjariella thermophila]GDY30956.1 serine/threonine protein kinase [Gandjariella thermophila]